MMGVNLKMLWEALDKALDVGNDFAGAQVEAGYGALHKTLLAKVEATETNFDNRALQTVELGIRDKLNELYPADKFPPG